MIATMTITTQLPNPQSEQSKAMKFFKPDRLFNAALAAYSGAVYYGILLYKPSKPPSEIRGERTETSKPSKLAPK